MNHQLDMSDIHSRPDFLHMAVQIQHQVFVPTRRLHFSSEIFSSIDYLRILSNLLVTSKIYVLCAYDREKRCTFYRTCPCLYQALLILRTSSVINK